MGTELTLLVFSTLLVGAHLGVQALLYLRQHGIAFAAGARDDAAPPDQPSGRAQRALRNLLETYALFVALALAVEVSAGSGPLTVLGAQLYFWSRWAYLPLYVFGVPFLRSLAWLVSAVGLALMFAGLAF